MKKFIRNILLLIVALACVGLFIFTRHMGGFRAYTVMSASMEPTIATGSFVLTQKVEPAKLKKGDIITFTPPTKERISVTHRVYDLKNSKENITFKTKGDNNKSTDPWTLTENAIDGKVVYAVPYLGYGFTFLKSKTGILIFILLPSVWIMVDEINSIISLFKTYRKNKQGIKETNISGLLIILGLTLLFPQTTFALLSDSASVGTNSYAVKNITNTPVPTQIPTITIALTQAHVPTLQPTATQIPTATQAPTVTQSPTPTQSQIPTQIPSQIQTPTPAVPQSGFPDCKNPRGKIIASYKVGMHEIIGVGLLKGSDVVYQLTEGSKEKVLQCYCQEGGRGIQTNWLKTSETDKYRDLGWPYSIANGIGWNLDDSPYVAKNIDYFCK